MDEPIENEKKKYAKNAIELYSSSSETCSEEDAPSTYPEYILQIWIFSEFIQLNNLFTILSRQYSDIKYQKIQNKFHFLNIRPHSHITSPSLFNVISHLFVPIHMHGFNEIVHIVS